MRPHQFGETGRLGDVLVDEAPELLGPVLHQRHPHLQRTEAAAGLEPEFVQPFARGDAARRALEIFGRDGEGRTMLAAIANEGAADLERGMQPFVRVEGHGIRPFDAPHPPGVPRRDGKQGADASVDMKPHVLFAGEVGERIQIVDGPRIHGSCRADDAGWPEAAFPVPGDRLAQRREVHAAGGIGRYAAKRPVAEAERLHRLAVAGMNLVGGVEAHRLFQRADPFLA